MKDNAASAPARQRPEAPPPAAPEEAHDERDHALVRVSLFSGEAAQAFRTEWGDVQRAFVDGPRQAVEKADDLVERVIETLARDFAAERTRLEEAWGRGGDVSTEDLRLALQRYRSFFDRLLSV